MFTCQLIGSHLHHFAKPLTYTEDNQPSNSQHNHHLVCDFCLHDCNMYMSQDCRQSPLKALLNTFGPCHKTHTMTTRCSSHDMEDVLAPKTQLPWILFHWNTLCPKGDNESSDEYSEETDICCPLAKLLEQFWQLKDQFTSLKSTSYLSTPMTELKQLTDKLHHLTMMLQPHSSPSLMRNQSINLCRNIQTPCVQHREKQTSP